VTARFVLSLVALLALASLAPVQGKSGLLAQSLPAAESIDGLLDRAMAANDTYRATFRDLTAEETRVGERYDKNGKVVDSRRIVSDLLIHRTVDAADRGTWYAEYRNVREVDGKVIKDAKDRVARLSKELSQQRSVETQLKQIQKESARYDLGACGMGGMTLDMGFLIPFANPRSRPSYEVSVAGRDRIQRHDVVILAYLQKGPSSGISWNFKFPSFQTPKFFARGRLWIDPDSGFIWREESDVMAQPAGAPSSALVQRLIFE
jgi:hypothetical protein